jgi:hypothetical protein
VAGDAAAVKVTIAEELAIIIKQFGGAALTGLAGTYAWDSDESKWVKEEEPTPD